MSEPVDKKHRVFTVVFLSDTVEEYSCRIGPMSLQQLCVKN